MTTETLLEDFFDGMNEPAAPVHLDVIEGGEEGTEDAPGKPTDAVAKGYVLPVGFAGMEPAKAKVERFKRSVRTEKGKSLRERITSSPEAAQIQILQATLRGKVRAYLERAGWVFHDNKWFHKEETNLLDGAEVGWTLAAAQMLQEAAEKRGKERE